LLTEDGHNTYKENYQQASILLQRVERLMSKNDSYQETQFEANAMFSDSQTDHFVWAINS